MIAPLYIGILYIGIGLAVVTLVLLALRLTGGLSALDLTLPGDYGALLIGALLWPVVVGALPIALSFALWWKILTPAKARDPELERLDAERERDRANPRTHSMARLVGSTRCGNCETHQPKGTLFDVRKDGSAAINICDGCLVGYCARQEIGNSSYRE